jgi:hypothetical protein
MKAAAALLTAASIIQLAGYFYALPTHLGDPTWSAHAQFHHVLGWIWLAGLAIGIIVLAWGPLQRRERWSLWLLSALFIFSQIAHFMAEAIVPAGRPPEAWYDLALGFQAFIYLVGLILAWRIRRTMG